MIEQLEIKPGRVVQLRSGGPLMTADVVTGDSVHCLWFPLVGDDYGPLAEGEFHVSELVVASE